MGTKSKSAGVAPGVITSKGDVYAYSKRQLAEGSRSLAAFAKANPEQRVNARAGNMRIKAVWDRRQWFNAVAAGEVPHRDEDFAKDAMKRGHGFAPKIVSDSIVGRPLSERGRSNYEAIDFGKKAA